MKKLDIKVTMEDGSVYTGQSRASDYVRYETNAKAKGWGTLSDNPSTWEAFVSWAVLQRTKQISMPFEKFLEEADIVDATPVAEVEPLDPPLSAVS